HDGRADGHDRRPAGAVLRRERGFGGGLQPAHAPPACGRMTRVPVDVDADVLVKRLGKLGYERARQRGSHITCTTHLRGEHHAYTPRHNPIAPGTLRRILKDIAEHHGLSLQELLDLLEL